MAFNDSAEELKYLQRSMSDLVSVLALPAVWSGQEPRKIVTTFHDALMATLNLDFLYTRARIESEGEPIEVLRTAPHYSAKQNEETIRHALNERFGDDPQKWPEFTAPDPAYHGMVFEEALRPIGNIAYIIYIRTHWLRDTGAAQSPWGAFLTLLGLETLPLRMERHSKNGLAVAEFLEKHPAVAWVNYPGLPSHPDHASAKKYLPDGQGAIVGFGIKGGKDAGTKLIDSVKLFSHLANIGDAKSLIIHPATTTHSQLTPEEQTQTGVTPEYVRLSVGIEDIEDIKADLDQALKASQK